MTAGPVNRSALESNYQDSGDVYDDTKTEGAFDVIADQIDDNWNDYAPVKAALNSTTDGASGAHYVKSASILGLIGTSIYDLLKDLLSKVLTTNNTTPFTPTGNYQPATKKYVDDTTAGVVLGTVPDGSVTPAKLSFDPIFNGIRGVRNLGN